MDNSDMFSVIKEIMKPQLGILQRVQEASFSVHAVKKLMTDPTLLSVLMGIANVKLMIECMIKHMVNHVIELMIKQVIQWYSGNAGTSHMYM